MIQYRFKYWGRGGLHAIRQLCLLWIGIVHWAFFMQDRVRGISGGAHILFPMSRRGGYVNNSIVLPRRMDELRKQFSVWGVI